MLTYHAAIAASTDDRLVRGLGIRDVMMAENLAYIARKRGYGGGVLIFAHNSHLQRGRAQWQLGNNLLSWWPAGAQLHAMFGPSYAVIGSAVGTSDTHGIDHPEPGTLEALLAAAPGPARFIPTYRGQALEHECISALATRSGSTKNSTYFPLTPQSITDFDWLFVLNEAS